LVVEAVMTVLPDLSLTTAPDEKIRTLKPNDLVRTVVETSV